MEITFNKQTALCITRALRAKKLAPAAWGRHVDLIAPDPFPGKRFTRKLFDRRVADIELSKDLAIIDVAVGSERARLCMSGVRNTVYGSSRSLPNHSFIEVDKGIAISCPELLFIEMADSLSSFEHLMLGHELCGSFSRDPLDPINGDVALGCPPVTSCDRIKSFLGMVKWNANTKKAEETLAFLSDNAWSPTESVVAGLAALPSYLFGYELGPVVLNERIDVSGGFLSADGKETRVPDILVAGTHVGLNYDGAVHLDLDSIVHAAMELERNPGQEATQHALDSVVREVRAKAVDDIRRNRELAAAGYIVFPVTKEDLYEKDGLDNVMLQVMKTIENLTGRDLSEQKRLLEIRYFREKRQQLIRSALPGKHSSPSKDMDDGATPQVFEVMIGF